MQSEIMVKVLRAGQIESIHLGHAVILHPQGRLLGYIGNPGFVTYIRSTAKLLQAIPAIESGAIDHFGFTEEELALMCSSHNGEDQHTALALSMLTKLGLTEEALQCGPQYPFHAEASEPRLYSTTSPTRLHNNCSGKHAGMLALAKQLGEPTESYLSPAHPVQQRIRSTISEMSDYAEARISTGIDGCGAPIFALPLHRLALAYSRLAGKQAVMHSSAAARILDAISAHPFALGGSGRFDSRLAQVTQGRIIGKMGAEGVYAAVHRGNGFGLAVKIEDGSIRALYPAVLEVMQQSGWLEPHEEQELKPFHSPVVYNGLGDQVGQIQPSLHMRR
jgi:L-asparaginase II